MNENDVRKVKRTQVVPGIFMEKYQEQGPSNLYYVVKIEITIFNRMEFTADFEGSQNVRFENGESLVLKTIIEPFTKPQVVRLILDKNWNLKTKYKFTLMLPTIEMQREKLVPMQRQLAEDMKRFQSLNYLDFGYLDETELTQHLKDLNWHFIDYDFPPTSQSLGMREEETISNFECIVHWRRARNFLLTPEELKKPDACPPISIRGASSLDIRPGKLEDFWILGALAVTGEYPKLIDRIFVSKTSNSTGFTLVKLCRMARWKKLALDDYFPCFPLGDPIFTHAREKESWLLYLEKAFAKLFGSYASLQKGDAKHAIADITGCPTYSFSLEDMTLEDAFMTINDWLTQKFLVASCTKEIQTGEKSNAINEFAYSIVRVAEYRGTKLIKLRNPWGEFVWTGDWAPDSEQWTQDAIETVKPGLAENDMTFWMNFEHFFENFDRLILCKIAQWHELRLKGKFVQVTDSLDDNINAFCSRWFYRLEVSKRGKIIVGLHQEDERYPGVKATRPYFDLGICIIKLEGDLYRLIQYCDTEISREVFLDTILDEGTYFIVPLSVAVCMEWGSSEPSPSPIDKSNPAIQGIIREVFEKYDFLSNDFLEFNEIKEFYLACGKVLSEAEYKELLQKYGKRGLKGSSVTEISFKGFTLLFYDLLATMSVEKKKSFLKELGYDSNLFSFRSRLFTLSVHSEYEVQIDTEDALLENIDYTTHKLLIKKFGKSIDEKPDPNNPLEVEAFFYFNEFDNQKNP